MYLPARLVFSCILVVVAAYFYHKYADLVQKVQDHDQALSDLASWKKDLDGAKNKLLAMEKTLSDMTSWKKSLEDVQENLDEISATTRTLREQMDQLSSAKRSMDDLTLQTKRLVLDVASLKESARGITPLRETVNALDVSVEKITVRMDGLKTIVNDVYDAMKSLKRDAEEMRSKSREFQDEFDRLRRSNPDRNGVFAVVSQFLGWVVSLGSRILQKFK